jgi:hypothetical protein
MLYREDRDVSDRMIPQIKTIVGPYLLEVAPLELDANEATDLIVFRARDMRIAARIRRYGYAERYPFDITLRCRRDSGAKTELAKIVEGWGDWFFYGHLDSTDLKIILWWLVDLHAFRAALIRENMNRHPRLRSGDRSNQDGTHFKWFDLRTFPPDPPILIASSRPLVWAVNREADLPLFSGLGP